MQCCIALTSVLLEGTRHMVSLYLLFSKEQTLNFTNRTSQMWNLHQIPAVSVDLVCKYSWMVTAGFSRKWSCQTLLLPNVMKHLFQDNKHSAVGPDIHWCSAWTFKNTLLWHILIYCTCHGRVFSAKMTCHMIYTANQERVFLAVILRVNFTKSVKTTSSI